MSGWGDIPPGAWQRVDSNQASRAITADEGELYQRHNTGHAFRYLGRPNQWERIDANSATVAIRSRGRGLGRASAVGAVAHHRRRVAPSALSPQWTSRASPCSWEGAKGSVRVKRTAPNARPGCNFCVIGFWIVEGLANPASARRDTRQYVDADTRQRIVGLPAHL